MATIAVGVRLDEALVKRIDEIADETGVSRTDVIERCIKLGMVREESLVNAGPLTLEFTHLLLSKPFAGIVSAIVGRQPNERQVKRFKHLYEKRRAAKSAKARARKEGLSGNVA